MPLALVAVRKIGKCTAFICFLFFGLFASYLYFYTYFFTRLLAYVLPPSPRCLEPFLSARHETRRWFFFGTSSGAHVRDGNRALQMFAFIRIGHARREFPRRQVELSVQCYFFCRGRARNSESEDRLRSQEGRGTRPRNLRAMVALVSSEMRSSSRSQSSRKRATFAK